MMRVRLGERFCGFVAIAMFTLCTAAFAQGADIPHFLVDPEENSLSGDLWWDVSPWQANTGITITIGDPAAPDFVVPGVMSDQNGHWSVWDVDHDIRVGDLVTVGDGVTTVVHEVRDLEVVEVDVAADQVSGWAAPQSWVGVSLHTANVYRSVQADVDGRWMADFSVPEGDGLEHNQTHDIQPGDRGWALQDDNGSEPTGSPQAVPYGSTTADWRVLQPVFDVNPLNNAVWGREWPAGQQLAVSIGNDLQAPAYTGTVATDGDGYWWLEDAPVDITVGMHVQVETNGVAKTHEVQNLGIPAVNADNDTVSGTTEPFIWVNVWIYNHDVGREVQADTNGQWIADFSEATGVEFSERAFDIVAGTEGDAVIRDEDGDGTVIPWRHSNDPTEIFIGWLEIVGDRRDPYTEFTIEVSGSGILSVRLRTPLNEWNSLHPDDWWHEEWQFHPDAPTYAEIDARFPAGEYLVEVTKSSGISTATVEVAETLQRPNVAPEIIAPLDGADDVDWPDATLQWTAAASPNFNMIAVEIEDEDEEYEVEHYEQDNTLTQYSMTGLVSATTYDVSLGFANYVEGVTAERISYEVVRSRWIESSFSTRGSAWPAHGIVLENRRPTFTWSALQGAIWYHLQVTRNGTVFYDEWLQQEDTTTILPGDGLPGGDYAWKVQAYHPDMGLGDWSETYNFSVLTNLPGKIETVVPVDTFEQNPPEFRWNETDAAYYNIVVWKNGGNHINKWTTGRSATTFTPAAALGYGSYEWKVRAWNPDGFGEWSDPKRIDYGVPRALGPNGLVENRTPEFSWDAIADAQWYQIIVTKDGNNYLSRWIQGGTTYTPDSDLAAGDYSWSVRGWSAIGGMTAWSGAANFQIEADIPNKIVLNNPSTRFVSPGDVSFEWQPDAGATWYQLWIGRNGSESFSQWYASESVVSGEAAGMTLENQGWGNYSWYVCGWSPDGMGAWSDKGEFTIGQAVPYEASENELRWDDIYCSDADWYRIWINKVGVGKHWSGWAKSSDIAKPYPNSCVYDLQEDVPVFQSGETYVFWIVPWSITQGYGTWSDGFEFGASSPAGMVLIPGGTNSGTDPDFSAYSLTLDSFYMDQYEVTKTLWDEVYTWAIANGYSFDNAGSGKAANHPVHTVNWYDVVKWCNARSEKDGRPPVYTINDAVYRVGQEDDVVQTSAAGYRLPTDTEWEYAARGGEESRRFPWGDEINHGYANYSANGSAYTYDTSPYTSYTYHPDYDDGGTPYTSPAGAFTANGYGLYDISGNVWEWCFDWHPSYVGLYRVIRGSSWRDYANFCRAAGRSDRWPATSHGHIGFRAVLPQGQQ